MAIVGKATKRNILIFLLDFSFVLSLSDNVKLKPRVYY